MCRHKVAFLPWGGATSMDDLYSFTHDLKGKTFTKKPTSLMSFITFLENNSKVKASLLMHKMLKDKSTKVWSVTPDKECLFVVKPIDVSKKEKPSDQNAGSYIKVPNMDNQKIGAVMRWRLCPRSKSATLLKNDRLCYKKPVQGAWERPGCPGPEGSGGGGLQGPPANRV